MTPVLPVWSTTKTILAYAWGERTLAIRYALPPVAALLLIDFAGIAAGIDVEKNPLWQVVTVILTLLAYAPFTVTWFKSIVHGDAEARRRPLFVLAELEKSVILANIRIMALVIVASVLMVLVGGGAMYGIYLIKPWLVGGVVVVAAPVFLYFWVMLITRASVAVAYSAAGEPITLREAVRLTQPMAYRATWVHIVLATIAFTVVGIAAASTAAFDLHQGTTVLIGLSVINAIGGFVYLILITTLFGFVYRRLKEIGATQI
jgi:hypothetical protein